MSEVNPPDASLEDLLLSLRPQPSGINRDQLMFAAGQAAAEVANRRSRRWFAASTAAGWMMAIGSGSVWFLNDRPDPAVPTQIAVHPEQTAAPALETVVIVQPPDSQPPQVIEVPKTDPWRVIVLPERKLRQDEDLTVLGTRPRREPRAATAPESAKSVPPPTVLELRRRWTEDPGFNL